MWSARVFVVELTALGTHQERVPLRAGEAQDGSVRFQAVPDQDVATRRPRHFCARRVVRTLRRLPPGQLAGIGHDSPDPTTRRPDDPTTRRPDDPTTRRPDDPTTRF